MPTSVSSCQPIWQESAAVLSPTRRCRSFGQNAAMTYDRSLRRLLRPAPGAPGWRRSVRHGRVITGRTGFLIVGTPNSVDQLSHRLKEFGLPVLRTGLLLDAGLRRRSPKNDVPFGERSTHSKIFDAAFHKDLESLSSVSLSAAASRSVTRRLALIQALECPLPVDTCGRSTIVAATCQVRRSAITRSQERSKIGCDASKRHLIYLASPRQTAYSR